MLEDSDAVSNPTLERITYTHIRRLPGGLWGEPVNVTVVNSEFTDGWPFISQDGTELWFTRAIGAPELFRSLRVDGEWTEPVKMFSIFSGEASLDNDGNVYFTHHFYKDDVMIEADIYVATRKRGRLMVHLAFVCGPWLLVAHQVVITFQIKFLTFNLIT